MTLDLTIRGVFRDADDSKHRRFSEGGEGTDFALPLRSAANSLLQTQGENGLGFDRLLVHADSEENVQAVSQEISARGLETFSMAEALDQVRMTILLITFATGFIAAVDFDRADAADADWSHVFLMAKDRDRIGVAELFDVPLAGGVVDGGVARGGLAFLVQDDVALRVLERLGERDGDFVAFDLQRDGLAVVALGRRIETHELAVDVAAEEAFVVVADIGSFFEIRHKR